MSPFRASGAYGDDTVTAIQSQIPAIPVQRTQVEVESRVAEYIQGVVRVAGEIAREQQFQSRVAEYIQGVVHEASEIAREKQFQSRVAEYVQGVVHEASEIAREKQFQSRVAEYVQGVVHEASEIAREKQFQSRVAEYVQGVVHQASEIAREKQFQSCVAEYVQGVVRVAVRIVVETDHSAGAGCFQPQKPDIPALEVMSESPPPVPKNPPKEKSKPCPGKWGVGHEASQIAREKLFQSCVAEYVKGVVRVAVKGGKGVRRQSTGSLPLFHQNPYRDRTEKAEQSKPWVIHCFSVDERTSHLQWDVEQINRIVNKLD